MSQPEQKKKSNSKARPLPVDSIREALEIDETVPSGLRWKVRLRSHFDSERRCEKWNMRYSGGPAGSQSNGTVYWRVRINNVRYLAHRIVFFLANGIDPGDRQIDHICADLPFPNVPSNLRLATQSENMRNQRKNSNNTSGAPGVCWNKWIQKWMAYIDINSKHLHLGYFTEFADAVATRKAAEAEHFGEFAYDASQSRIASPFQHTPLRN